MKLSLYKSYGVLAHEGHPVYSVHAPASDIFDRITVEVSDELIAGETEAGELLLTLSGVDYPLDDTLTNAGDAPAICWSDGEKEFFRRLRVCAE